VSAARVVPGERACLYYPFALVETDSLRPHEQVDEAHLRRLTEEIRRDGVLYRPVLVDRQSLVILDGHHRVLALRHLGCRFAPAYLVDYDDARIQVWPRRRDVPVSKSSVIQTGTSGRLYPPKTSRHVFPEEPAARPMPLAALGSL